MERHSPQEPRNTTVQDTVAVLGIACLLCLMFLSVALSREPDWLTFWFALATLVLGFFFYGRCARAIRDFLDEQHILSEWKNRFGGGAD
jgi:hypothetical protein